VRAYMALGRGEKARVCRGEMEISSLGGTRDMRGTRNDGTGVAG